MACINTWGAHSNISQQRCLWCKVRKFHAWKMNVEWLNVDETLCPFAFSSKRTYHLFNEVTDQHKEKVWISQPGSGLDKRQCTVQICFCPTGPHQKLAIIFRGTSKRISDDEIQTWHLDVELYFQQKAWVDTKFSCDWAKNALKQTRQTISSLFYFVITSQLSAQTSSKRKCRISTVWFGMDCQVSQLCGNRSRVYTTSC